jgi:uncharacterized membrane protein (UPF0127 family)
LPKVTTTSLSKVGGSVVCARCTVADTARARMKGLLGRSSLDPDEGILLTPGGSVHMFFMRFAIDAIFCDRDLNVIDVARNLRPWRVAGRRGAKTVIEVAAGAAADVHSGDRLVLGTIDP